jgi:fructokinase
MSESVHHNQKLRPIIYGEVLFDCFPDGHSVLGGAPFNVAWHLHGLGLKPQLLSSVGNDARGKAVLQTMAEWGMDTSGVQVSEQYPTGQVAVSLDQGQPSYDIVTAQAYDHILSEQALAQAADNAPALIYHGSLALREATSRHTLDALLQATASPVFLDLNLRAPWWQPSLVDNILQRATWVKLNDEELCQITGNRLSADADLQVYARELLQQYGLQRVIVTRGEHGAFIVSHDGVIEGKPVPVSRLMDTVGAGDAFSAITIAGLLRDWPLQLTLDRALAFASVVCQQRGATAQDASLYVSITTA